MSQINDFVIKIATVNGTGSASANGLLLKALFRMGIPVVGKNYFPSNIQGLPTWYEIRVTKDGHMARAGHVDVMVALNIQTYQRDMAELQPGGVLIYDSTWPRNKVFDRDDIAILGVPLSRLCNEHFEGARSRILLKNIAYVGVLTALLDIDRDVVTELLAETYAAKPKLLDANREAIALGYDFANEHFACPLPHLRVERMDKTAGHIMIDGNTAAGLGAVYAGATVGAWYPITPSTSLMDAFKTYCEKLRIDPETGDRKFCIIQAEDELAAIGMVLGASWAGARAFTPTSGPGISLMSEFIGFAYYSETPAVIFDVQRVGPSTGMPTRTQQSDLVSAAYASHGDTRHVLLFPADPSECFEFAPVAFDLAERLQTPVIVLSDLDIGMNDWMCREFTWDANYVPDRGKVLTAEEVDELPKFHRYLDTDGDGIAYRTLPGEHRRGAFFTRGSGHNRFGGYTEDSADYQDVLDRLLVKWATARTLVPAPAIERNEFARAAVLTLGSADGAAREAIHILEDEGVALSYCRVRAFPFNDDIKAFIDAHDAVYVVEQNRDAQLRTLLMQDLEIEPAKLIPTLFYDGMPIDAPRIVEAIRQHHPRTAVA
ncbi:MAG: 2-oxoacid:acceptor oxidoreductase subunit alpha [Pseudomonadota bacterium]